VEGRLDVHVVYPVANAQITSRDSNFIFGSVGNGRATLTIDGMPVPVQPNGSFLAWLPLPSPDQSRYELVAALGPDTSRVSHPVRLLPQRPLLSLTGLLSVDSNSVTPRQPLVLRDDDPVRVSVRAPANAAVWVHADTGAWHPLVSRAALPGASLAVRPESVSTRYLGGAEDWATDVPSRLLRGRPELVVARGIDTVRLPLAATSPVTSDGSTQWVVLGADSVSVSDTDRVVIARPTPGGTYKWFFLPGTAVELTGRQGDFARVRLDGELEVWVAAQDVRPLPAGAAAPRRIAENARVVSGSDWSDVVIPVGERPPFLIEEIGEALVLTLYGVRGATDVINYAGADSLVGVVSWEQVASDRLRYTVRLRGAPYGYLVMWDRGNLVLRLRRPPQINASAPLRGLVIAVDPGHPPIGATGPTGLYEPVPTLAVGLKLKTLLEARGATVVMTRSTPDPVALGDRPIIARRAGAHALISIHLNALPDGINPFTAHGTGTYFFHPQAEPLARAVQRGMIQQMGLRDLGINYDNLALARPTWMPSILCEGAFLMLPDQEAALRTPEFQERYARGIADGLERYFRSLGAGASNRH
jgi:N-acetylmuramoyl-L-alanine amidase